MEAKTDWTNNSSEMERKRNRASYEDKRQSGVNNIILLVAMRFWETPVHIPNTMVKTKAADDTILVTVWERVFPLSASPPKIIIKLLTALITKQ